MNSLAELVEGRSGSALTDMLTEPPKLVESLQNLAETGERPPLISLGNLFGPSKPPVSAAGPVRAAAITPRPSENGGTDAEDDEPYVSLSAEEIKTKAESKAEMWGAVIALFFGFVNRYTAYQKLREGDKALVREFENIVKITGTTPDYKPDHPYFAARERWDEFEEALSESDDDARLNDAQLLLLRRAIEADLKAKNRRGQLKTGSIAEVLFEIMIVKAMAPLMQVGMLTVNRMVDKTMR